jgi:PEGA domain-containing protein
VQKRQWGKLICGFWLICGTAWSQSATGAREHYAHGLEFVARGQLDDAVVEFEAAYRIRPNYLVQYNLGQAYLELGNPGLALRAFETYLKDGGLEVPPGRRREVQALLALCKKRVGYISFDVDRPGAEVLVDGRSIGKSPVGGALALAIGTHGVTATAPGYLPFVGRVDIESQKEHALHIGLEPEPAAIPSLGQLATHCLVPSATLRFDGAPLSARDGQPTLVSLGMHRVSWQRKGYLAARQEVEVKPGSVAHVRCELRPNPQLPMSAKGILTFLVTESEAEIWLDGRRTSSSVTVPEGPHFVRVHRLGFEDWTATVDSRPSFPRSIQVRLHPTASYELALRRAARGRTNWAYVIGGAGVALLGTSLALYVDNNHRHASWALDNAALDRDLQAGAEPARLSQEAAFVRERAVSIQVRDDWAVGVGMLGVGLLSYAVVSWLDARRSSP